MTEIVGSVWNANNWHWEEKNYTKWGKEELTKILESFKYCLDSSTSKFELEITNILIKGEASISVRKKHPILAYEFVASGTWYLSELNDKKKILEGQISIPEFSVDNYEEEFPINLTLKKILDKKYDSNILLNEIKKKMPNELRPRIATFHILLLNNEGNQKKLADEKLRLQEEQKTTEIARITKEEEKKQIYDEQIEKETNTRKQVESEKKLLGFTQTQIQGSIWNTGSWHWEERPETNWVKETLKEKIESLLLNTSEITKFSSNVSFNNVKVTGEASSSVRKGKKICVLDCSVTGKFNVIIEGEFCENKRFNLSGVFTLTEINMIDTNDYIRKVTFDSAQIGIMTSNIPDFVKIKESIQKQIINGLDNAIQEFCLEFLNK